MTEVEELVVMEDEEVEDRVVEVEELVVEENGELTAPASH